MPDQRPGGSPAGSAANARARRERIFRGISIALMLVAVGGCVVLMLAFVVRVEVAVVALSGVLAMGATFYLFVKLWPGETEPPSRLSQKIARAKEVSKPKPMSPEEYRRQRARAQKLIREKAAPALAKAIRGILRQDEMRRRRRP